MTDTMLTAWSFTSFTAYTLLYIYKNETNTRDRM